MLSIFRTNQAYAGLLLFLYALVLWLPFYLMGDTATTELQGNGVLGEWLSRHLEAQPFLAFLLSVLLVGVQGLQANAWATRHRLSRSVTQFPGLFLVLLSGMVASAHTFHSYLFANLFLLFGMLSLGRLYKREQPAVALFNAGAWLGIASLFRPEYLLFAPAFFIVIGILRRPDLRSVFQLLTGLLMVYFFLAVTGYLSGNLSVWIGLQVGSFGLPGMTTAPLSDLIGLGLLGLILLTVLLLFGRIGLMLNIEGSKNLSVLGWLLFFSALVVVFAGTIYPVSSQVIVVPLGLLLGLGMVNMVPSRAEAVHLVMVAGVWAPLLLG